MKLDDNIKEYDEQNELKLGLIPLNLDKCINYLRAFEIDERNQKRYVRGVGIAIGEHIITGTFMDTIHFIEELRLYNIGNEYNKYLKIVQKDKVENLRVNSDINSSIYISKSEAKAMCKIFDLSFSGISTTRVLDYEYRFTPETLNRLLKEEKLLEKK